MDLARLNFSHGDHADHGRRFHEVRQAAETVGRNLAVLADLQGPKIRLGRFADGPVLWKAGERVRITVQDILGDHDRVSTTYKQLAHDVRAGDRLLVDDGNVGLVAVEVDEAAATKGRETLEGSPGRALTRNKISEEDRDALLAAAGRRLKRSSQSVRRNVSRSGAPSAVRCRSAR